MMFKNKAQKGFSLVELMIVVGIIGILAALAVPRFSAFQAKARQAEAKTNLGQIYTLQESYFLDNNTYAAVAGYGKSAGAQGCDCNTNAIGFSTKPCTTGTDNKVCPRYRYSAALSGTSYIATAASGTGANNLIVPNCATADSWQIDANRELKLSSATSDAVAQCN